MTAKFLLLKKMKRIVKETDSNGVGKYRVQSNRLMGFIPCRWHTITYYDLYGQVRDAVFDTYHEALRIADPIKKRVRKIEVWNSRDGLVRGDKIDEYE